MFQELSEYYTTYFTCIQFTCEVHLHVVNRTPWYTLQCKFESLLNSNDNFKCFEHYKHLGDGVLSLVLSP